MPVRSREYKRTDDNQAVSAQPAVQVPTVDVGGWFSGISSVIGSITSSLRSQRQNTVVTNTSAPSQRHRIPVATIEEMPPPPIIRGMYYRVGMTFALLGSAGIAALMWYYGGGFTLDYLHDHVAWFVSFFTGRPAWTQWFVPTCISAAELFLWPNKEYRWRIFVIRLALWLLFLGFDVMTTYVGTYPWVSSWTWNAWITDSSIPYRKIFDFLVSVEMGLAIAYLPEKIARWVLGDLWNMWIAPVWRWMKRLFSRPKPAPAS